MQVWLVFIEFQADTPAIEGVFASRQSAEKRARQIISNGTRVWGHEDAGDDDAN